MAGSGAVNYRIHRVLAAPRVRWIAGSTHVFGGGLPDSPRRILARRGWIAGSTPRHDRENQDFLVAAHALALEQAAKPIRPCTGSPRSCPAATPERPSGWPT